MNKINEVVKEILKEDGVEVDDIISSEFVENFRSGGTTRDESFTGASINVRFKSKKRMQELNKKEVDFYEGLNWFGKKMFGKPNILDSDEFEEKILNGRILRYILEKK